MRVYYRLLQTWRTLTSKPQSSELLEIKSVLSPGLYSLFIQMHPSEQAHSIAVYKDLQNQDIQNKDLLAAALLHDAGKNRYPLSVWERITIVLGETFFPEKAKIWSEGEPEGWKRPFVVAHRHAEWGADLAAQAGASRLTADLIRRHKGSMQNNKGAITSDHMNSSKRDFTDTELLFLLQRSDNLN